MKKSIYVMLFGIALFILAYILRTKEVKDELNEEENEEDGDEYQEPQPKPKSKPKTEPAKAVIIEPKPTDNENAGNE